MHDCEQEHSGLTGCRVTYESTIFYNEANKFSIIVVKTSDPRIPPQACNGRYYGDRMLRFTAAVSYTHLLPILGGRCRHFSFYTG